jgi:hypothetical protein
VVALIFKGQMHDELDVHPLKMRPPCDLKTSHDEQPVVERTVPEELICQPHYFKSLKTSKESML